MNPHQNQELNHLLKSIYRTFEAGVRQGTEAADELVKVLDLFHDLGPERIDHEPQALPGCRHLAQTLKNADSDAGKALAFALRPLSKRLRWIQNPNYVSDETMHAFVSDYGYTDIIGPRGYVPSQELAAGFLLMGPNLFYPAHNHPAIEVYFVISGHARWQRGEESWRRLPPGTFIYHASQVPHAMQTEEEPLLALYAWRNDLNVAARLS